MKGLLGCITFYCLINVVKGFSWWVWVECVCSSLITLYAGSGCNNNAWCVNDKFFPYQWCKQNIHHAKFITLVHNRMLKFWSMVIFLFIYLCLRSCIYTLEKLSWSLCMIIGCRDLLFLLFPAQLHSLNVLLRKLIRGVR